MNKKLGILVFAAACGGGGGDPDSRPPTPDSPPQPDAPPACTTVTLMPTTFAGGNADVMQWLAVGNEDLGDPTPFTLSYEFYNLRDLSGATDLAAGDEANYATCATCFRGFTLNAAMDDIERHWFQQSGTLTLTESPFASDEPAVRSMIGMVENLTLIEVTIDPNTFESTPVDGGECLTFNTLALTDNDVPDTWTCAAEAWDDTTACDCVCGQSDPDCGLGGGIPTNGCGAGQICSADACVTPPPNDTCAGAEALTLGTGIAGTNVNAAGNYNDGLEGDQCTTFSQSGPDVTYSITLAANQSYTVALTGLDATYDGSVALIGPGAAAVCDEVPIGCVAGADGGLEGEDETFTYTVPAGEGGNYFVIVDSFYPSGASSAGAYTLTVTQN